MSIHILNQDVAKLKKGTKITIPDDESSILIKGKGYFIQIYRDSELLSFNYPDIFYKNELPENYRVNWGTSRWLTAKLDSSSDQGYYEIKEDGNTANYPFFIKAGDYTPIFLDQHNSIKPGQLCWKYLINGHRILGIASSNAANLGLGDDFNRFISLETYINTSTGSYESYCNYTRGESGYYQYLTSEELDSQSLRLKILDGQEYINNNSKWIQFKVDWQTGFLLEEVQQAIDFS